MSQFFWACFSQKRRWLFVSSVVNGPSTRGVPRLRRELCANLRIHAQIRTAFCNWNLCSTSSTSFSAFTATPSTFCTSLASVWLSSDGSFSTSAGQRSGDPSHLGPCHHRSASSTCPPHYIISILSVSCETSPRGSYIFASLAKIPLFLSVAFSGGTGMLSESCFLFHGSPSMLENVPCGTPNCCFA